MGLHQGFSRIPAAMFSYMLRAFVCDTSCSTSMTATRQTAGQLMQAYFIQYCVLSCDASCHKILFLLSIEQLTLKQSQQKMRQEVQGLDHQQRV